MYHDHVWYHDHIVVVCRLPFVPIIPDPPHTGIRVPYLISYIRYLRITYEDITGFACSHKGHKSHKSQVSSRISSLNADTDHSSRDTSHKPEVTKPRISHSHTRATSDKWISLTIAGHKISKSQQRNHFKFKYKDRFDLICMFQPFLYIYVSWYSVHTQKVQTSPCFLHEIFYRQSISNHNPTNRKTCCGHLLLLLQKPQATYHCYWATTQNQQPEEEKCATRQDGLLAGAGLHLLVADTTKCQVSSHRNQTWKWKYSRK